MSNTWLSEQLRQRELDYVEFRYEETDPKDFPPGALDAATSSRTWQEDLVSEPYEIPPAAIARVHARTEDASDALAFRYEAGDYEVDSFHVLDHFTLVLRNKAGRDTWLSADPERAEELVRGLAAEVFSQLDTVETTVDARNGSDLFGHLRPPPSDPPKRPAYVFWWRVDGRVGFSVPKEVYGRDPTRSAAGDPTPEQVQRWFDTFTRRRWTGSLDDDEPDEAETEP